MPYVLLFFFAFYDSHVFVFEFNKGLECSKSPIVIPQFVCLCDVCGCVMSPTSDIYWVDLGFINNYKEPQ